MMDYMDNRSNSRANTCWKPDFMGRLYLLDPKPIPSGVVMKYNNWSDQGIALIDHSSFCPISFRW